MDKVYQPKNIEDRWYSYWESKHYFDAGGKGLPYSILLPPPNVTGSLHMGHGFCFTLMDILIRYHRMMGDNTLWQPGTDHAGIATQMVVERQLAQTGQTRQSLGRENFIKKTWEWKEQSGDTIVKQMRRLGASCDWDRLKFTLDEKISIAVRDVFIRLFDEGYIYRGTRLVNWDPKMLTAISDLEVVSNEEEGKLYHIRYPLLENVSGDQNYIIVATTRPETLLGDVAVAVHPEDERYQSLIGKQVRLPLTERTIPIIADDFVDKTFGSGFVKITPAHDFNDYEVGQRHHLPLINILTPDAHLNDNVPKQYQGMERFAARAQIIKDLEAQNLLEKIEKHISKIPRGEKSDAIVEPYLTQQWFMKMKDLAKPAIAAVASGKIKFTPDNWTKTYFQWMENIEDWCISRQLWWGHRIPIWYDENQKAYAGQDELDVRKRYQLSDAVVLKQDEDVLDTWFSSALWPFTTLGWHQGDSDITLKTFYPTSVLVTGFDIIFFWVARMIMMGLKFAGDVPFREVFITGLIRDADGHKMSKSKGNVLDPIDMIDGIALEDLVSKRTFGLMQPQKAKQIEANTRKQFPEGIEAYGTDALRFTFCSLASHGREIRFDLARLEGYRNFCNKLWNAARYVMMNMDDLPAKDGIQNRSSTHPTLSLPDRWILSKLQHCIASTHASLHQYRFDLMAQTVYEFTWDQFCDWYLELSKPILYIGNESEKLGTRQTLLTVLETLLRLLHPIMPFITEEIWQRIAPLANKKGDSIMVQPYPQVDTGVEDSLVEAELEWVKNIIIAVRTIRSEMNISPGKPITLLFNQGTGVDKNRILSHGKLISALTKAEKLTWLDATVPRPQAAAAYVGELEILIPMAGLINVAEETVRLEKEIAKLQKEMDRIESKLNNANFIEKAPKEIIAKEQEKLSELSSAKNKFATQIESLK